VFKLDCDQPTASSVKAEAFDLHVATRPAFRFGVLRSGDRQPREIGECVSFQHAD
jgi:hypothetical protein